MKLLGFSIAKFRSILDSGFVDTDKLTVLLGRNESGKSNVLYALETIKNPTAITPSIDRDYPKDLDLATVDPSDSVVAATFELTPEERAELTRIWPRARPATEVVVYQRYRTGPDANRSWIRFNQTSTAPESNPQPYFRLRLEKLVKSLSTTASRAPAAELLRVLLDRFSDHGKLPDWKARASALLSEFTNSLLQASIALTATQQLKLDDVAQLISGAVDDSKIAAAARRWIYDNAPNFIYYDEYPDIPGSQSISQYLDRVSRDAMDAADDAFKDFLDVSGLDLLTLQSLLAENPTRRTRAINQASARLTERIRAIWHDRPLSIRINVDGDMFDILVADPTLEHGIELNLDDRSKGFQWFFGFMITVLAAQTHYSAIKTPSILLLDEPGLHLHPSAQEDLLTFLDTLPNQVIYSTHLPFMVPLDSPRRIRYVEYSQGARTVLSTDMARNGPTAMTMQALLGYHSAKSFHISQSVLLVEGASDYWLLQAISGMLNAIAQSGLDPSITISPCNGMSKTAGFASLYRSNGLNVVLLLDSSDESRAYAKNCVVRAKILAEDVVLFVGQYCSNSRDHADIEDLFDLPTYERAVAEVVPAHILQALNLTSHSDRVTMRYERAFSDIGQSFPKIPIAKKLSDLIARDQAFLTVAERLRFETLFRAMEHAMSVQTTRKTFR